MTDCRRALNLARGHCQQTELPGLYIKVALCWKGGKFAKLHTNASSAAYSWCVGAVSSVKVSNAAAFLMYLYFIGMGPALRHCARCQS